MKEQCGECCYRDKNEIMISGRFLAPCQMTSRLVSQYSTACSLFFSKEEDAKARANA
jgi:hypothetical protein